MKNRLLLCAGVFFLLFVLFFPLDFLGSVQKVVTVFLFGNITELISINFLDIKNAGIDFSSDSISMYILIGLFVLLSVILSTFIKKIYHKNILYYSKEIVILYLGIILIKYGFDKVFKAQFYLPEPNILYTRFGNLDKDILFWSTMGTSRFYSIFMGVLELFTALLLLINKTRIVGLIISIGIFGNIFFINVGFDISVKLFSFILLFMAVFALKDEWVILYHFLVLKKEKELAENLVLSRKIQPFVVFFKTAFLGLSLVMILFPYISSGNYNDDLAERPFIHGAFENLDKKSDIKYIFFHRNHYLIIMDKNERTKDFHYSLEPSTQTLILEDYNAEKKTMKFSYQKPDSLLTLNFGSNKIEAKELNWHKMRALKPLFHLIIEDVK